MNCKNCGNEINNGDKFCTYCGHPVNNEPEKKGATFSDGIKAVFGKTFVFSGKSSRSEFNFGLLFIYLISIAATTILSFPLINDMPVTTDYQVILEYFLSTMTDPLSAMNVSSLVTTLLLVIFMTSAVYRRSNDVFEKNGISILFSIIFALGQLLGTYHVILLFGDIYDYIIPFVDVLSFASLFVLLTCIFCKSKK